MLDKNEFLGAESHQGFITYFGGWTTIAICIVFCVQPESFTVSAWICLMIVFNLMLGGHFVSRVGRLPLRVSPLNTRQHICFCFNYCFGFSIVHSFFTIFCINVTCNNFCKGNTPGDSVGHVCVLHKKEQAILCTASHGGRRPGLDLSASVAPPQKTRPVLIWKGACSLWEHAPRATMHSYAI